MKNATFSILLLATMALTSGLMLWRSQRATVAAAPLRARAILYYVDPMHPTYKSDKPGIAPDCNMALEPVYADGVDDESARPPAPRSAIHVAAETQQLIGVRVATVEASAGSEQLRLLGRVVAPEPRIFKLIAGLDGYAREVSDVTTGSQVSKDQWLLTFSAPEIRQPIQGFIATLDSIDRETRNGTVTSVQMAFAKASGEQAVDRLLTFGMSAVQIDEIRRTHVVPPNIVMAAPVGGFVVARNVSTGEKIEKGAELFRIADLRRVWVLADVAAQDGPLIKPGMSAEVTLGGVPLPVRARLTTGVLPQFDAATQHFKLRFEVDNTAFALRPDMFVDVHVTVSHGRTIEVPADAVVGAGLKDTVFVERSAGSFEAREVKVGRRSGDRVEILEGVVSGERIVVSGTFLLDSESRMRAGAPARVGGHD